jgi:hypothetical protein
MARKFGVLSVTESNEEYLFDDDKKKISKLKIMHDDEEFN